MLDLKLLATFREVAVRGSFSAAADALGYTQPAVSQHIGRLEKLVGSRLLVRDARGVRLTPEGQVLLDHASLLLEASRRAVDAVREASGAGRPHIRIGAFPSVAAGLVPGATRALRARRPDARVELRVLEADEAMDELLAGRLDIATLTESDLTPVLPRAGVEHLPLCEDPLLVVLPVDHPRACSTAIDLADLSEEPWLITCVGGTCADSNVVLSAFREAGFEPNVALASDDYPALQGMAAAGVGVALIPTLATATVRGDVVLRPVRGRAPARRIVAAVRAGEREPLVDHAVEALRAAARDVLATQPAAALAA
jgi:DNA-binding transcriptional LysR family regulator